MAEIRAAINTNDPIQASLQAQLVETEAKLKGNDLDEPTRRYLSVHATFLIAQMGFQQSLSEHKIVYSDSHNRLMAEHKAVQESFSNLMKAEGSRNPEEIAIAKQALANQLAAQMARRQGIPVSSSNQSFETVVAQLHAQVNARKTHGDPPAKVNGILNTHVVIYSVACLILVPLLISGIVLLCQRGKV